MCRRTYIGAFMSAHHHAGQAAQPGGFILTARSYTGLSGDMLLTGLAALNLLLLDNAPDSQAADVWLDTVCASVYPPLAGRVRLRRHFVSGIGGFRASIDLPPEHEHRNLADIRNIINQSGLSERAREGAISTFQMLAHAEASVHGKKPDEVHFHEVGALDSILDVCLVWELFVRLDIVEFVCGPLPLADGSIICAHGALPAPAPATLILLRNAVVTGFTGSPFAGELVTPTAAALLGTLPVRFGAWPEMRLEQTALVYGQKEFPDTPNGVIFALGVQL